MDNCSENESYDVDPEFSSENLKFCSLNEADRTAFEALRLTHNNQKGINTAEEVSAKVFDLNLTRRKNHNLYHAVMVFDKDFSLIAAVIMKVLPVLYSNATPELQQLMQSLGITDENNIRIDDRGIVMYEIMTNWETMTQEYLSEIHTEIFAHCCRLSTAEYILPVEKTQPYQVAVLLRPNSIEHEAVLSAGYSKVYTEKVETDPEKTILADRITWMYAQKVIAM